FQMTYTDINGNYKHKWHLISFTTTVTKLYVNTYKIKLSYTTICLAYNLVYLLKFVAKAYNYDDTGRFCKREKKRSKPDTGGLCRTCWSSTYGDPKNRTG